MESRRLQAGVSRRVISPFWGVELAGWGYYLQRTWTELRDDLFATACCLAPGDDPQEAVAVVTLDLMTIGNQFAADVRRLASEATGIPPTSILLTASHSHNAPTTGALLGVGDEDPLYVDWAAREAATAIVQAWRRRRSAQLGTAAAPCPGLTYNRTRDNGPVDQQLTLLRVDDEAGVPLALIANFQGHPTVWTERLPRTVTRDLPGEVCDALEAAYPTATAMYIQGACGDVNFLREFHETDRHHLPGETLGAAAVELAAAAAEARPEPRVAAAVATAALPVRHWSAEEIEHDRSEASRRLAEHDLSGWRETIGRVMVNRPDDMVRRHGNDEWKAVAAMCRFQVEWTDRMQDQQQRPLLLETEAQAIRLGDLVILANASEFFTTLALDVRDRCPAAHTMIAAYANGRIGYLPDAHDVQRRTYAAYQSPKYCSQLPFVEESGGVMCDAMVGAAEQATGRR